MMTTTQLELLVQQAVDRSIASTIVRHVDRISDGIVEDILKESRAEFMTLIQAAIKQALANLNQPPLGGTAQ
jgi:hypothetical protein